MNDLTTEQIYDRIKSRVQEAIEIGRASTDGEYTASGLTYALMQDLGLVA